MRNVAQLASTKAQLLRIPGTSCISVAVKASNNSIPLKICGFDDERFKMGSGGNDFLGVTLNDCIKQRNVN